MRKLNAAGCLALALAALVAVAPARAAVEDGLLEARVTSFENGVGAAVTFRNFHTLFHTERVPAGPHPWVLERTPVDLSALRYEFDGGCYDLAHFLEHNRTNALLVLKDGKIVQEIYRNGANEESRFISFSVGKSLTSSLLGLALAQGALPSLDAPVTTYVPKLKGTGYDGASVRDLMQMSSGVHMNEDYDIHSEEPNLFAEGIYQSWFTEALRFSDFAATLDRAAPPGTVFNYNTFDTQVLGSVLEEATGQRFNDFLGEALWGPLGMESDLLMIMDSAGDDREALAGGGYLMTLRDFGRFGQMMLNGGVADGRRIHPRDWVDEATQADPARPFLQVGAIDDGGVRVGYQHQWWLFPKQDYSAEGVFGQYIYVMPRHKLVIVKLSYWEEAWVAEKAQESLAFFNALGEFLAD
ncbi:MAG: serine hydrolase domain-containing protein [Pseudomonadales bacterium]